MANGGILTDYLIVLRWQETDNGGRLVGGWWTLFAGDVIIGRTWRASDVPDSEVMQECMTDRRFIA